MICRAVNCGNVINLMVLIEIYTASELLTVAPAEWPDAHSAPFSIAESAEQSKARLRLVE